VPAADIAAQTENRPKAAPTAGRIDRGAGEIKVGDAAGRAGATVQKNEIWLAIDYVYRSIRSLCGKGGLSLRFLNAAIEGRNSQSTGHDGRYKSTTT
jgi:hypothetical protein